MTQAAQSTDKPCEGLTLANLPVGATGQLTRILGDASLSRRLLGLGLRRGARLTLLQRRGSGVVVECNGNRVALGESVARRLILEPGSENSPT